MRKIKKLMNDTRTEVWQGDSKCTKRMMKYNEKSKKKHTCGVIAALALFSNEVSSSSIALWLRSISPIATNYIQ